MSKTIYAAGATILTCLLVIILFSACGQGADRRQQGVVLPNSVASQGESIFRANCAVCHGAQGQGQPNWRIRNPNGTLPPPPLNGDGHTWHHSDGLLYQIVSQGGAIFQSPAQPKFKSGMPAFGQQLSHQEVIAALNYIKTLWGDKMFQGRLKRESQAILSESDPFPEIEN